MKLLNGKTSAGYSYSIHLTFACERTTRDETGTTRVSRRHLAVGTIADTSNIVVGMVEREYEAADESIQHSYISKTEVAKIRKDMYSLLKQSY